jgi:hypothetical protein
MLGAVTSSHKLLYGLFLFGVAGTVMLLLVALICSEKQLVTCLPGAGSVACSHSAGA